MYGKIRSDYSKRVDSKFVLKTFVLTTNPTVLKKQTLYELPFAYRTNSKSCPDPSLFCRRCRCVLVIRDILINFAHIWAPISNPIRVNWVCGCCEPLLLDTINPRVLLIVFRIKFLILYIIMWLLNYHFYPSSCFTSSCFHRHATVTKF